MLLPTIVKAAYDHTQSRLGVDPYAAWSAAIGELHNDSEQAEHFPVGQLWDYLDDIPQQQRSEALLDLIAEHMRLAWQAGEGTRLEPYLAEFGDEFAELASAAVVPADLVEDEFLARYVLPHGDTPAVDEYQQRFPTRADVMKLLQRRFLDGGRYVKLQQCGRGAMGEVCEAYDCHLRRLVAIKRPKQGLVDNADLIRRFSEEALVTAALEHPAIVSVHENYEDNGAPFYVMRLAAGETLTERIREYHQPPIDRTTCQQRLIWNQLLHAFATVCDAIAYAHSRGVLHRDLKPGNIIVGQFGETAILDWGMAKRFAGDTATDTGETSTNVVVGTPQYMPPEQADGIADQRSDVFGLGAILYEMLIAHPPHAWTEGSRPADWLHLVRQAQFPPPRCQTPQSPRAAEAICMKALARNPAERYQSAADLAHEVRRYLAGEPVTAWTEPLSSRARRWLCGRRL